MAKYCIEKFESGMQEKKVYWRQDKHVHNAALITQIEIWLGQNYPQPTAWTVRANSYQSNQNEPHGANVVEYTG
ncbi:MAG: hypothetical protein VXZ18_16175 [Pseudomonadota bacterium]|jgi:hypothetical protein|uniref:Uncharacterized protein n=2 Tax=Thalassococcus halodurans TaxID=373675 RepID=A0A1H6A8R6_9RHOB|nr:hypothetical protein [Thalassococcus sp.]MBO6867619.1 hypothetical protein [Thalassococcus sp.]MEC8582284.1 hypothetical protein [Pseudomonadota bacterium]SEG44435.1 hypothetical protein SAMN04488045_2885 [Thalassococcus halodurans]